MSTFSISFNLKIKEPKNSVLFIRIQATNDYASLKTIMDKLVQKYNYSSKYIKESNSKTWTFEIDKLNNAYQQFIQDIVKITKGKYIIKSITSDDKQDENHDLYIDFILPTRHLSGKYKLNKYGEPEYKGEYKNIEYIIDKMMYELFKDDITKDVYKIDEQKYGLGYDITNLDKITINDWRNFYHKLYFLQQMFLDIHICIKSDDNSLKNVVTFLRNPDLLFKEKNKLEFKFPRYNSNMGNIVNKLVKRIINNKDVIKDLPQIDNYTETYTFTMKDTLTKTQITELKRLVDKYTNGNIKVIFNDNPLF